jgi:hypothetical protein
VPALPTRASRTSRSTATTKVGEAEIRFNSGLGGPGSELARLAALRWLQLVAEESGQLGRSQFEQSVGDVRVRLDLDTRLRRPGRELELVQVRSSLAFLRDSHRRHVETGGSACECRKVTLLLRFANGDQAELTNADGRTLVQRLWRMGVGRASRDGLSLSVAISDAFVDDFTVDVEEGDLAALKQVLFGLGATMQLTPGLGALRVLIDRKPT